MIFKDIIEGWAPRGALLTLLVCAVAIGSCRTAPEQIVPNRAAELHRARVQARRVLRSGHLVVEQIRSIRPKLRWSRSKRLQGELLVAPLDRAPDDGGPRPVLFLMMDTTRVDHLSAYGYERPTSPHIDAIASEGVLFSRFYSNASWTRPSVASMLTSRYRREHLVEIARSHLPRSKVTLAEHFKAAGYATAAVVGNQTVTAKHGFGQGFDEYVSVFDGLDLWPDGNALVDKAIGWLAGNDNPNWFLWMFMVDPHDPYKPTAEFDLWGRDYDGPELDSLPVEFSDDPDARALQRLVDQYDGEIRQMDAAIGRLVTWLKATGQWERLTVVVVADHGELFGEHKGFRHSYHFWEENLHVPFILRTPWLLGSAGRIEDRLFQGVDIAPTLLDLAGIDPGDWRASGISAADVMTGPVTKGWDRTVYAGIRAFGIRRWMVRRGDYKYMRFEPTDLYQLKERYSKTWKQLASTHNETTREYIFNVADDPGEAKNLLKKLPLFRETMLGELARYRNLPTPEEFEEGTIIEDIDPETLRELRSLGYIE